MSVSTNFLPHTYSNGGYSVTINSDRSIKVQEDDWLSKYSMAIYNDFDHIDLFKRPLDPSKPYSKANSKEIENKDVITVGETLYHSGVLPAEPMDFGEEEIVIPNLHKRKTKSWLERLTWGLVQDTEWTLTDALGGDISISVLSGQIFNLKATRKGLPHKFCYRGMGVGAAVALEDLVWFSASTAIPDFAPYGSIRKFPTAGPKLEPYEFEGSFFVVEVGGGFGLGLAFSLFFFGIDAGPIWLARQVARWLAGYERTPPHAPMGCIPVAGVNATTPALGITFRFGEMWRTE